MAVVMAAFFIMVAEGQACGQILHPTGQAPSFEIAVIRLNNDASHTNHGDLRRHCSHIRLHSHRLALRSLCNHWPQQYQQR
jgi:hypothetical protein